MSEENWEGVMRATLERRIFEGLALTNVCAEGDLIGPEVWGKERVRRERETERGEAALIKGPLRLYKLMRDVAETLEPSDPDSCTQTDGQAGGTVGPTEKKNLRATYSLSWK